MARLRKPDPKVMTKEDYDLYSRMYEEKKSKAEIRAALDKATKEQAAKEAAYKPEPTPVAKPSQDKYAGVATKITPEMGLPMPTKDLGEAVTTYKLPDGTLTTTKPSPVKGWRVMLETINIAFNPFSDKEGGIVATMGGKTFRSVAEFVANHPYMTAFVAALGIKGAAALTAKTKTGIAAAKFAALPAPQLGVRLALPYPLYAVNTATTKLTGNMLAKAGFSLVSASVILGAVGSYPFSRFELVEAMDKIGLARWKAFEAGDIDSMEALNALQDEILNPDGWDKLMRQIPYANVWNSVGQNIKAAEANRKVFDKLIADEQAAKDSGESEDAKWERIKQEEADQEKANIDYYNSERKKLLEWEHEAEAAARAAQQAEYIKGREKQRAAEIKAREEDACFWAKERERQRELEAADRIAIAKFWMAYRKQLQKLREESSPSQLNFGLL